MSSVVGFPGRNQYFSPATAVAIPNQQCLNASATAFSRFFGLSTNYRAQPGLFFWRCWAEAHLRVRDNGDTRPGAIEM